VSQISKKSSLHDQQIIQSSICGMHVFSSIRNRIRLGWSAGTQAEHGASTVGKGHDIFHIRILSHTSNGIVGINGDS